MNAGTRTPPPPSTVSFMAGCPARAACPGRPAHRPPPSRRLPSVRNRPSSGLHVDLTHGPEPAHRVGAGRVARRGRLGERCPWQRAPISAPANASPAPVGRAPAPVDALGHLRLPTRPAGRPRWRRCTPLHDHRRAPGDRGADRGGERGGPGQPEQLLGVGRNTSASRAQASTAAGSAAMSLRATSRDPDPQVTRLLYEPGQSAVGVQVTPGRPLPAQDLQPALVLAALGLGARRQVAEERRSPA